MHTAFFGLPNNSQVIRVRGAAAPRVFLTRITCFLSFQNHTEFFLISKTEPPMNMALTSKVESLIRMIDAFKTARYDQHVGHEARFVLTRPWVM